MLNPVWRLSVSPLAGLEGQGRRSVGGGGPPGGVSRTFPQTSSTVCGTHAHAFVCPYFHQRGCARGGHPGFDCQGCCGACSTSVSWLLQPPVCGLEDLGVVATCHRPISSQSLRGRVALPDGDHPVCSSVCLTGGLDGLHRPSGGVSPGSCSSGISSLPSLCGSWPRLPVHRAVLRSVHGPAGLHSGYGSCVSCTTFLGYPYTSLPGRLARPGLLTGGSPPGPRGCLVSLSGVGDRCQPGEIQLLSVSGGPVSRGGHRRADFYGFSIAKSAAPPASLWQSLLGMLSSLSHLVPGGRLRMRSLQICLHRSWDQLDPSAPVAWSPDCLQDLRWWLHGDRLSRGVSLRQVSPDLDFWSDASDVGWGAHLGSQVVSGLWDQSEALLPVNARELLAVCRGLLHFQSFLSGPWWRCFATTSPRSPICARRGGTRSPALNAIAQEILRWAESLQIGLAPQFIPGIRNVLADSLSHPHQLPSSEWSLNMDVFHSLTRQWPVMIDLFPTSDNHRCSIYFSPFRDPLSAGMDALLQSWDGLLAYAFPPWSILPQVLAKLRVSNQTLLTLVVPYWPQRPWFVDLLQLSVAPPVALPARPDLLFQPRFRQRYLGLHRLALHAWRLSGDSPERLVSPRR